MKRKIAHLSNILARKALRVNVAWASRYWKDQPFGSVVRAYYEKYYALWQDEKENTYPPISSYEQEMGHAISKDWLDELALHTQIVIKDSPLCYQHGRILYTALSAYLSAQSGQSKNVTIYETGTARGFSSTVMAKAISDKKASGKIITYDVLPHHTPMYWNCIDDCEKQKSRSELLSPWDDLVQKYIIFVEGDSFINLKNIQSPRINFAFLDGAHSFNDVFYEFETIAKRQQPGDVIMFDDYNTRQFSGLVKAVDEGCILLGYDKHIVSLGADRSYVIATKLEN